MRIKLILVMFDFLSGSESSSDSARVVRLGRCKWFNVLKGWGFIVPEDGGQEVFVHQVGI